MLHRLCCLSLLLAAGLASAAPKEESDIARWFKSDKDSGAAPTEAAFELPVLSKLKEWRVYKAGRQMGDNRVEIAADSVTIGTDTILRYVVAIVTPGGVRNTFYEGVDCHSGRYRQYAWGSAENTWKNMESVRWRSASLNVRNTWQGEVIQDFCTVNGGPLPVTTIQDALRGGELPSKFR